MPLVGRTPTPRDVAAAAPTAPAPAPRVPQGSPAPATAAPGATAAPPAPEREPYAGDTHDLPDMTYRPEPDGQPDPGEVVWAWVPYEEDHTQGKDRPVLVIGWEGPHLVAVPLTSKDHDLDARQERKSGREWVDVGTGGWDPKGRPSEVRVNRLLRIDPDTIRREGSVLAQSRYDAVVAAIRAHHA